MGLARALQHPNGMTTQATSRKPPQLAIRSRLPDLAILLAAVAATAALIVHGADAMNYKWQWYRVPAFFGRTVDGEFIPGPLLRGLEVTVEIVALAMALTLVIGLAVALMRLSQSWAAWAVATFYLEVVRNTPLLIQIYVFYFVLGPIIGIPRLWVGVLSLAFFEATFAAEVFRGSILAVPRGPVGVRARGRAAAGPGAASRCPAPGGAADAPAARRRAGQPGQAFRDRQRHRDCRTSRPRGGT